MDCQMPRMDGCQATSMIRKWERARCGRNGREQDVELDHRPSGIPIIGLTAYENHEDVCREAGMNSFLTKPVPSGKLISALAQVMRSCRRDMIESQPQVSVQAKENATRKPKPAKTSHNLSGPVPWESLEDFISANSLHGLRKVFAPAGIDSMGILIYMARDKALF